MYLNAICVTSVRQLVNNSTCMSKIDKFDFDITLLDLSRMPYILIGKAQLTANLRSKDA